RDHHPGRRDRALTTIAGASTSTRAVSSPRAGVRRVIAAIANAGLGVLLIALASGRPLHFFTDPLRTLAALLIVLPTVAAMLVTSFRGRGLRMNNEERFLTEQFGDAYRDHMRHTRRLVPGVY